MDGKQKTCDATKGVTQKVTAYRRNGAKSNGVTERSFEAALEGLTAFRTRSETTSGKQITRGTVYRIRDPKRFKRQVSNAEPHWYPKSNADPRHPLKTPIRIGIGDPVSHRRRRAALVSGSVGRGPAALATHRFGH